MKKQQTDRQLDDESIQYAIRAGLKKKPSVSKNLRCCMIECAAESDAGSIGAHYVAEHARRAGYLVDALPYDTQRTGYDVELISVHHCTDWPRLAALPKRAKIRIIGGHVMANNPRPGIPMADIVCIGEGESWIVKALDCLEADFRPESVAGVPGTIISSMWKAGDTQPEPNVEDPLPDNDPYLNRPGTLSARWYIEIARGCPYNCAYCELGHSMPYRFYRLEHIKKKLASIDHTKTSKLNWFAPDEASHPDYNDLMATLKKLKYQQAFGSYRVDQVLRRDIQTYSASQLIRVGVDGLTEETRFRVGKKISDDMLVEYFQKLSGRGHVQFKMFMMFGYPWEKHADFGQWELLMKRIMSIPVKSNCWLRIKWTPLIPQPCTPLADVKPRYDIVMAGKIQKWHSMHKQIVKFPGWHVECDGLMSAQSHARQVQLTWAKEGTLISKSQYINPAWRNCDGQHSG
jgi:hypothetical protein